MWSSGLIRCHVHHNTLLHLFHLHPAHCSPYIKMSTSVTQIKSDPVTIFQGFVESLGGWDSIMVAGKMATRAIQTSKSNNQGMFKQFLCLLSCSGSSVHIYAWHLHYIRGDHEMYVASWRTGMRRLWKSIWHWLRDMIMKSIGHSGSRYGWRGWTLYSQYRMCCLLSRTGAWRRATKLAAIFSCSIWYYPFSHLVSWHMSPSQAWLLRGCYANHSRGSDSGCAIANIQG